jgi:hypothetical protein
MRLDCGFSFGRDLPIDCNLTAGPAVSAPVTQEIGARSVDYGNQEAAQEQTGAPKPNHRPNLAQRHRHTQ